MNANFSRNTDERWLRQSGRWPAKWAAEIGLILRLIRLGKPLHGLWMSFKPQRTRGASRIEPELVPPRCFVAMMMELAMMSSAQGDGELVAHPAPERAVLGKAQMMSITG